MNTLMQTIVEKKLLGAAPPLRPLHNHHRGSTNNNDSSSSSSSNHSRSPSSSSRRRRQGNVFEDMFFFGQQTLGDEEVKQHEGDNEVPELNDPRDLMTLLLPILQDDKQWHRLQRSMRDGEHGTTGMTSLTTRFFVKELIREHYAKATQQERHELFAPILAEAHMTTTTTPATTPRQARSVVAPLANKDAKHLRKLSDSSADTTETYCSYSSSSGDEEEQNDLYNFEEHEANANDTSCSNFQYDDFLNNGKTQNSASSDDNPTSMEPLSFSESFMDLR